MTNIRTLRLSRGLSLVELALLTDIPARTLAEIEYGMQRLDYESRARLARVFDTPPDQLWAGVAPAPRATRKPAWPPLAAPALATALAGALLLSDPLLNQLPPPSAAARAGVPAASSAGSSDESWLAAPERAAIPTSPTAPATADAGSADESWLAAPERAAIPTSPAAPATADIGSADESWLVAPQSAVILASSTTPPTAPPAAPTATAAPPSPTQPPPAPQPRFVLAEDGPHGCPLAPEAGRVVMTQGYGVGTHAPASIWGAVDLGIDGDGDGYAEPGATQGTPVFATHGGVAHVFLDSWPGGNFVRVVDEQTGWSTAYAHLDTVLVADGQIIPAGATIGAVGSTGMTSGPHLHYEVWHGGENIDPSWLIECG